MSALCQRETWGQILDNTLGATDVAPVSHLRPKGNAERLAVMLFPLITNLLIERSDGEGTRVNCYAF